MNRYGISRRQLLAYASLAGLPAGAAAAGWPEQPVKFIVPYAPGATTDLVMRMASRHVADQLGQPVVMDSRPGAGGAVGMSALAKSAPDGYTIGATSGLCPTKARRLCCRTCWAAAWSSGSSRAPPSSRWRMRARCAC